MTYWAFIGGRGYQVARNTNFSNQELILIDLKDICSKSFIWARTFLHGKDLMASL